MWPVSSYTIIDMNEYTAVEDRPPMSAKVVEEWLESLNDLRQSNPTLWAILRGRASVLRIAQLTLQPISFTLRQLVSMEKEGILRQSRGAWFLDRGCKDIADYEKMKQAAFHIEYENSLALAHVKLEPGYVSSATARAIKQHEDEFKAKSEAYFKEPRSLLTDIQMSNLRVIRSKWDEQDDDGSYDSFSVADYKRARALGSSEYALKELSSLAKKGMIEPARKEGKSPRFRLTQAGVEHNNEPISRAELKALMGEVGAEERTRELRLNGGHTLIQLIGESGPMTTAQVAEKRGITRSSAHRQLSRLLDKELVVREQMGDGSNWWSLPS